MKRSITGSAFFGLCLIVTGSNGFGMVETLFKVLRFYFLFNFFCILKVQTKRFPPEFWLLCIYLLIILQASRLLLLGVSLYCVQDSIVITLVTQFHIYPPLPGTEPASSSYYIYRKATGTYKVLSKRCVNHPTFRRRSNGGDLLVNREISEKSGEDGLITN